MSALCVVWEVCGDQEMSVVTQISRTRSKHLVGHPLIALSATPMT